MWGSYHASATPDSLLPQQKFALSSCMKEAENLQQLLVFVQQKTEEENAHIEDWAQELKGVPLIATAGV